MEINNIYYNKEYKKFNLKNMGIKCILLYSKYHIDPISLDFGKCELRRDYLNNSAQEMACLLHYSGCLAHVVCA
jgi:hypothetical protein